MRKRHIIFTPFRSIIFGLFIVFALNSATLYGQVFNHPGILNNKSELEFIKDKIQKGEQPWKQAYEALKITKFASLSYKANASSSMDCGSYNKDKYGNTVPQCKTFVEDGMAAYTCALVWYFSEDKRYANKSIEILNTWARTYNKNEGSNARLNVSWAAPWYCNAAEIIRHCNSGGTSGWSSADILTFEGMLAKFLPYVKDETMPGNNWIQSAIEAHFAMAVFTSNRAEFNSAVSRWKTRVKTYIYQKTDGPISTKFKSAPIDGICMETARDLGHTKLGINSMMYAAQTAHEQGVDLFTIEQKRLSDFFELHGSWMTGAVQVPSNVNGGLVKVAEADTYGIKVPSGGGGAAFEIAYNHLNKRLGRSLPYTAQMISRYRPAGIGQWVFKPETLTHGNLPFNFSTPIVAVTSITVTPSALNLIKGQSGQLSISVLPTTATNKSVTFSSSNLSVATVNSSGLVSTVNAGTAIITVKTTDGNKIATTSVTVSNPVVLNQAPILSFSSPLNGSEYTAPASVKVLVNASDADGLVASVDLYINNNFVRQEKSAPYEWNYSVSDFPISNLAVGTYTLKAIATDNLGKTTETSILIYVKPAIILDPCTGNTAPVVSLTSPITNASYDEGTSVTLSVNATDNGSIAQVEYFDGSISLGKSIASPFSISMTSLAIGTHTIIAVAKDNCGATKTSSPSIIAIKKIIVNTDPIVGPSCASKSTTISYELNPSYRTNVTGYSWWFSGSQAVVTPVAGSPFKATVVLSDYYSGGSACVGLNLSVAPYYTSYCKVVGVCGARIGTEDMMVETSSSADKAKMYPNPTSADILFIESNEFVKGVEIKDAMGNIVKEINAIPTGLGISIQNLSVGTYMVRIILGNDILTKKLVIIQ